MSDSARSNRMSRWVVMGSLILAGGAIYALPYLRQSYHSTMREAMHLTNTELGTLNSIFGVFALLCYFPGGWVADRFSPRLLLSTSLVVSGLVGFWMAELPSYNTLLALHAVWGVTTILTFWAALIKATRGWGSAREQGRAFGILDGGRGVIEAVLGAVTIALFASFADKALGLSAVIRLYAGVCVAAGIMVAVLLKEPSRKVESEASSAGQMIQVMKLPVVWVHALVILCAYSVYWGTFDFTAYATDGFGQSEVFGAKLSNFRVWLRPIAAIAAGIWADRISPSKAVVAGFAMVVVGYIAFAVMPASDQLVWMLWVETAVVSVAVYALRGVYYALMEQGRVPLALTGSAVGLVSIIGYTPDIFMPLATGWLLDSFPGAVGHRYLFGAMACVAGFGILATLAIPRLAVETEDGADNAPASAIEA